MQLACPQKLLVLAEHLNWSNSPYFRQKHLGKKCNQYIKKQRINADRICTEMYTQEQVISQMNEGQKAAEYDQEENWQGPAV